MRKIIQISAVPAANGNVNYISALCNDGTLWNYLVEKNKWIEKIPIPQDLQQPELTFVEQRDRIADMLDRRKS